MDEENGVVYVTDWSGRVVGLGREGGVGWNICWTEGGRSLMEVEEVDCFG